MTSERRLIVGFDDLKAVAFQCKNCGARISIQAKSLRDVPLACASCNVRWRTIGAGQAQGQGMTAESAAVTLIESIVILRVLIRNDQDLFRVLLEFEEPKPAASN
jgi:hypothetical protein